MFYLHSPYGTIGITASLTFGQVLIGVLLIVLTGLVGWGVYYLATGAPWD